MVLTWHRKYMIGATLTLFLLLMTGSISYAEVKLLAADDAGGQFGYSVCINGDVALVGAPFDDNGSAYVFRWNGANWVQEQKLIASGGARSDFFGVSVSINGDVALVGALGDDDNGDKSGSAYVFRWNGSNWKQEKKLVASDGAAEDYFGTSVSLSGNVAIVGAFGDDDKGSHSGSAYFFRWNGDKWEQEQKLLSSDGAEFDGFGGSVSISGDFALVGAGGDDDNGHGTGAVYFFRWNGTNWGQEQKLVASDGAHGDSAGGNPGSVSINGDVALVGVTGDDDNGDRSGSAYVFRWNGANWVEEQKLLASDGEIDDRFGRSVSISGDVALVGAPRDEFSTGSAYFFRWNGANWVQEKKLLASDGAQLDTFGDWVSISGDVALVGAPLSDSAYVYQLSRAINPPYRIPRYRLYNPNTYHHHYTTDANEYNVLGTFGWIQEGTSCYFYNGYYMIDTVETVPYYRLYNPNSYEHHWTTDANEYKVLGTIGWMQEGADGYVFVSQVSGSAPLYRLYNPNDGLHHWTMDAHERNVLIGYGWVDEGIACYVFP